MMGLGEQCAALDAQRDALAKCVAFVTKSPTSNNQTLSELTARLHGAFSDVQPMALGEPVYIPAGRSFYLPAGSPRSGLLHYRKSDKRIFSWGYVEYRSDSYYQHYQQPLVISQDYVMTEFSSPGASFVLRGRIKMRSTDLANGNVRFTGATYTSIPLKLGAFVRNDLSMDGVVNTSIYTEFPCTEGGDSFVSGGACYYALLRGTVAEICELTADGVVSRSAWSVDGELSPNKARYVGLNGETFVFGYSSETISPPGDAAVRKKAKVTMFRANAAEKRFVKVSDDVTCGLLQNNNRAWCCDGVEPVSTSSKNILLRAIKKDSFSNNGVPDQINYLIIVSGDGKTLECRPSEITGLDSTKLNGSSIPDGRFEAFRYLDAFLTTKSGAINPQKVFAVDGLSRASCFAEDLGGGILFITQKDNDANQMAIYHASPL